MADVPMAMHIPDGFLSPGVAAALFVVAAVAVAIGLRDAEARMDDARVPLLGVLAAFIFAAQMLNFPVAGGTSGHVLGAALAAVLLGPWTACLVIAVVLAVQALLFADGGITALGANVVNMGVLGALVAGLLLAGAVRALDPGRTAYLALVAVAAWLAVVTGAAATSLELALSGTVPLGTVLPAMLGVHALIGIGEAVVTVAAVSAVLAARPDLLAIGDGRRLRRARAGGAAGRRMSRRSVRVLTVIALAASLGLATGASPFASSSPDGLERVAGDKGFFDRGRVHSVQEGAPIPDYAFPGVSDPRVATGLAGFAGTLVVFALGYGVAAGLRRRRGSA